MKTTFKAQAVITCSYLWGSKASPNKMFCLTFPGNIQGSCAAYEIFPDDAKLPSRMGSSEINKLSSDV